MILKEMEKHKKTKFDKQKCLKCKWRNVSNSIGVSVKQNGKPVHVHCDYAFLNKMTCLQPGPNNTVVDLRGEDYNDCKLFVEGTRDPNKSEFNYY